MAAHAACLAVLSLLAVFDIISCLRPVSLLQIQKPIVINTWPFTHATDKAWDTLARGGTAIDAVVAGCGQCEVERCDGSVGSGSHPDENGETTLDAMVMDGLYQSELLLMSLVPVMWEVRQQHNSPAWEQSETSMDVGSVGGLRQVANAVGVAHAVMKYTDHTLLVGELATDFALEMGFNTSDLHSNKSIADYVNWKRKHCQPNYRQNVSPDPHTSCGPYQPLNDLPLADGQRLDGRRSNGRRSDSRHSGNRRWDGRHSYRKSRPSINHKNHDTIGMVTMDLSGHIACGTSTNGLSHKVPGRVGDSPIAGAGAYTDGDVGGAAATGNGDIMMRFLPSFHIVEMMRSGASPTFACRQAVKRIATKFPHYTGAVVALTVKGEHAAGCYGLGTFTYSVRSNATNGTRKYTVKCVDNPTSHHHHRNNPSWKKANIL